jgi:hypothetical protein
MTELNRNIKTKKAPLPVLFVSNQLTQLCLLYKLNFSADLHFIAY